jgi:hypothetical protein
MDTPEIIRQLSHADLLPREAILAAREKKAEIAPLFLEAIEDFLAGRFDTEARPDLLFFAVHLLAEWRETAAYRPLIRLARSPGFEEVVGEDAAVETCHRVIAAVFDGDPAPLTDAILDPAADEYVRSRMCEALAMLTLAGKIAREDAAAFLQQSFVAFEQEENIESCFVWTGWQSAIAILGLEDLVPLVSQAFEREFIDPAWMEYRHFERDLQRALAGEPPQGAPNEYAMWDDCIDEFSHWYGFSEEAARELARQHKQPVDAWPNDAPYFQAPASNPLRHVGRNDPCPCGSGMKFKKCCLAKAA